MKQKLYLIIAGLFLLTVQVNAQSPNALSYQGVARTLSGSVLSDSTISIRFTIHQGSASGPSVYQETQSAQTNQFGLFTLELGQGTIVTGEFDTINWSSNAEYLEVEMDPNGGSDYINMGTMPLLSVPYALYSAKAGNAVTATNAVNATNSIYSDTAEFAKNVGKTTWTLSGTTIYNNNTGAVGVGTATPSVKSELDVESAHQFGAVFNSDSLSNSSSVVNATFTGTGKFNAAGVTGTSTPADGSGYGGVFTGGNSGIRTSASGTTAANTYYGAYNNGGSTAASTTYGTYGNATATGGHPYGVYGAAKDNGSGTAYGVYGTATSTSGSSYGLYGIGNTAGVYGASSGGGVDIPELGSPYGSEARVIGIFGETVGTTANSATYEDDGVLGISTMSGNYHSVGVCGYGTNATGSDIGVFGMGQGIGSENYVIAVYGYEDPAQGGGGVGSAVADYAGYFIGNVDVTGTLTAGTKNFKIDDPLDPANKYLYHDCVESPDMMNIYNGNITTDANGNATITLPPYFMAENKDFKYQLTAIGQFAQAIVATEISNNQFTIKTDKPNIKVSWQVTGVRNDPFANNNRTVAEVPKKGIEKGHYLYPQYYGQPQSLSIANLIGGPNEIKSATTPVTTTGSAIGTVTQQTTGNYIFTGRY